MDARLQQAGASTGVQAATAAKAPKTAAEAAETDVTERVAGVGEPAKSEAVEELLEAIKLKVSQFLRRHENEARAVDLKEHLAISDDQYDAVLQNLQDDNKIMLTDDTILLI